MNQNSGEPSSFQAQSYVMRGGDSEIWKVSCWVGGRLCYCTPDFNSKGAADAYASAINKGTRKPELPK